MTSSYRVKVDSVKARLALRKLSRSVSDLSDVFGGISERVAADARALAPKQSGRLASSIRPARYKTAAVATADLTYAGVHEFGWAARNISAQPYLRPAADTKADSSAELIARRIDRHITAAGLS